jgi:folate-dependent phosphoribosylglycinamide formyltransferase PurN
MDHNDYEGSKNLGVILGARILSKEIIERMPKGILNIHPGILPGNRGLDNLKHSIAKRLPIGVTAHLIDSRIDMGIILDTKIVPIFKDDTIRDVFIRQRGYEQKLLIEVLKADKWNGKLCQHSEKFSAVDEATDTNIHYLFNTYKKYHYESISLSTDIRG